MSNNSLGVDIKIEVIGANLVIDEADVSVKVVKTDGAEPNKCTCNIYNLSESTYNDINDKANALRIYVSTEKTNGYLLLYQGDLRNAIKKRKTHKATTTTTRKRHRKSHTQKSIPVIRYNKPAITNEQDGGDIVTVIELEDGVKDFVLNGYYEKNYASIIDLQTIIADCLKFCNANNMPYGRIDAVTNKYYPNGQKVSGDILDILRKYCKIGGCILSVQNNILSIVKQGSKLQESCIELNGDMCPKPEFGTDKEIKVYAPFIPSLNPTDYVYLNFDTINGFYPIKNIEFKVDTFGQNFDADLTCKY